MFEGITYLSQILFLFQAPVVQCNEKLTTAVRKDLASAIRDLMQHGLMPVCKI